MHFREKTKESLLKVTNNREIMRFLENYDTKSSASKAISVLGAAHRFLYSSYRAQKGEKLRETISKSFEKLIMVLVNEGILNQTVLDLQEKLSLESQTLQPMIFAIGKNIENTEESFFMFIDSIVFKINNFDKCLEVFLK